MKAETPSFPNLYDLLILHGLLRSNDQTKTMETTLTSLKSKEKQKQNKQDTMELSIIW